ncbi:MAG: MarR family winged helix-turn-helix transcriptional regulator [Gammaproteobacteria bacterium]
MVVRTTGSNSRGAAQARANPRRGRAPAAVGEGTAARGAQMRIEDLLTFRLSMLFSLLRNGAARTFAERYGLALREWRALALLAQYEPMTATGLAARSPMDKASVSRAVAGLVARGLVAAGPHPRDARVQTLALSAAGRRLYRRLAPLSLQRQEALLEPLSRAERDTLFALLEKVRCRAEALFGAPADAVREDRAPRAGATARPPGSRLRRVRVPR